MTKIRTGKTGSPLYTDSVVLAATLGEPAAIQAARKILAGRDQAEPARIKALAALVALKDASLFEPVVEVLDERSGSPIFRGQVLAALGGFDHPKVADLVLARFSKMDPDFRRSQSSC